MYTKKKGLAALLAAVTGLSSLAVGTVSAAPAAAEDTEAVKILSLGDSITDGYWTSGAYRKYMYHDLEQMGYNIDMVGPKGSNSNTFTYNGQTVSYDDNNAGYSGYAIQEMTTKEHRSGILETTVWKIWSMLFCRIWMPTAPFSFPPFQTLMHTPVQTGLVLMASTLGAARRKKKTS